MTQYGGALDDRPEMLGVPNQRAKDAQPVCVDDSLFPKPVDMPGGEFPLEEEPELPKPKFGSLIGRSGIGALITLLVAGLFLVVLSQALALTRTLREMPDWLSIPAFAAAGLLLIAMLAAGLRLASLYLKLRASPLIEVSALQQLAARAEMRDIASRQFAEACRVLRGFVENYPLDAKSAARLRRYGFQADDLDRLRRSAAALTGREMTTYESWLGECDRGFLAVLDGVARKRVRQYAIAVGVKTAAVPTGFADTVIVLLNAYLMIGDLCRIYNLRATRLGTLSILAHVFVNAFSAAHLEELTDAAADGVGEAVSTAGGLLAGVARTATARLAEGTANGLLFRRLGTVTMRQLRPIQLPK